MTSDNQNPFKITTPEDLTAEEADKLFVDVFADFYQITDPGHVLLKGPRGVGKSMMLRFLEADCQCLHQHEMLNNLPYIGVYVPLKNTSFSLAELKEFEGKHAYTLLNEHIMITHCLIRVFDCLNDDNLIKGIDYDRFSRFYKKSFLTILEMGQEEDIPKDVKGILSSIIFKLNQDYREVFRYIKKTCLSDILEPYTGELFDYNNYFIPLIESLADAISDCNAIFYLMLDDAHFLSVCQTQILNSWIASRTSRKVSIKVSTQYNYKTYYTINGATIDTPHDYVELDMATIYTVGNKKSKSTYYNRISDIVKKRLELFGIDKTADEFFPVDDKQEKKIKEIEKKYIERFDQGKGKGTNRTDDANRYARPDYIKSLGGKSKSTHTYSYAGFNQFVNISSGVVRYFLQQAHTMYAKQRAMPDNKGIVTYIEPSIQNEVIREKANRVLFSDLEAYAKEGHEEAYPKEDFEKLSNLIQGLGGMFRKILLSDGSERRIFSVAISDKPSDEVLKILNIGIDFGYFYKSTIGRKNAGSIGRTKLYVLNRTLAPIWTLDPNGFAGYLFLKSEVLEKAMIDPFGAIKSFEMKKGIDDSDIQISLFDLYPEIEKEAEIIDGEIED